VKHTQGSWYAKEGQIYPEETGKTLALIPYFDAEDKEQEANAQLIAASPELLEACESVLKSFGNSARDYYEMTARQKLAMERVVNAINKAEL
jgi:hypothetical protein